MTTFIQRIKLLFQGFLMGIAAIIPGVSSGTVAVILKFYDKLVQSVDHIVSLRKGYIVSSIIFLGLIYGGNFIALFTLATPMERLLEVYPNHMKLFFIGLILGSLPLIYKKASEKAKISWKRPVILLTFVLSVGLLVALNVLTDSDVTSEPITVLTLQNSVLIFFTGIIASATAIVPGVSGSMVQLAIGMYSTFIAALSDVNVPILLVMFSGMIIGLVGAAKLIGYLLEKAYHVTYVGIIGLLVGSVIQILPEFGSETFLTYIMYGVVLILGFLLAFSSNAFDNKKIEIKLKKEI